MHLHPLQEAYFLQLKEENDQLVPARVVFASHDFFRLHILGLEKEVDAKVRGHFHHEQSEWPVVGDWVVIERAAVDHQFWPIEQVLPRRTCLKRVNEYGKTQNLAANADYVAIVTSFNQDLNERRLDRGLAMVFESGAKPLLVLNKKDLVTAEEEAVILEKLRRRFSDVKLFSCSAETKIGIQELIQFLKPDETIAVLGMSGVGKSTLLNCIMEKPRMKTQVIREDDARGRHTTTHREMFLTGYGFWVIDSPGIRAFSFAGDEQKLDDSFEDITSLYSACRFRDCSHTGEVGCAVWRALENGELGTDRWKNYSKMKRELEFHENKSNKKYLSEQKKFFAKRTVAHRAILKPKKY